MPKDSKKFNKEKAIANPGFASYTLSGLIAGSTCAALFNPLDKAIYLSVKHHRPFLSWSNFSYPFQGTAQAVFQRSIVGASYYVMQGEVKAIINAFPGQGLDAHENEKQVVVGMTAGCVSAVFNNPLSVIKYYTWAGEKPFIASAASHWQMLGMKTLTKGLGATVGSHMTWGVVYELCRNKTYSYAKQTIFNGNNKTDGGDLKSLAFTCNMLSSAFATIVSSPLYYARTMQYATPIEEKPPSTFSILRQLKNENSHLPLLSRVNFFRERFKVGWIAARGALSMAVGQAIFDETSKRLAKK